MRVAVDRSEGRLDSSQRPKGAQLVFGQASLLSNCLAYCLNELMHVKKVVWIRPFQRGN
jgi:hypothetical protein